MNLLTFFSSFSFFSSSSFSSFVLIHIWQALALSLSLNFQLWNLSVWLCIFPHSALTQWEFNTLLCIFPDPVRLSCSLGALSTSSVLFVLYLETMSLLDTNHFETQFLKVRLIFKKNILVAYSFELILNSTGLSSYPGCWRWGHPSKANNSKRKNLGMIPLWK